MKILIALDASAHSERAVEFVARMRWPAGSRVIVMSALVPVANLLAAPTDAGPIPGELLEEERHKLEEVVARAEGRLREAGFSTEGRVVVGDPREALIQVAQEERADLVVVGSHGRTGLAKLILGSVSSHVVTHSPCSVMVVKAERRS